MKALFHKKDKKRKRAKKARKRNTALSNRKPSDNDSAIIDGGLDINQYKPNKKVEHKSFLNNGSPVANWMNRMINNNKYKKQKNALYKRYNSQMFGHTTIEHLAYKGLTKDDNITHYKDHGRHYLILADDLQETSGYAEMIKIGGASLSDLPDNLILQRMSMFIDFLRSYQANIEFVSLPLPNDSRLQQHEWNMQLKKVRRTLLQNTNIRPNRRAQLIAREAHIQENLEKFRETDLNLVNQGFIMIIYEMGRTTATIHKLDNNVRLAYRFGSDALNLEHIDYRQKEEFLRHLNNPNSVRTM